jgi:hypothetical protein
MADIVWPQSILDILLELSEREREIILDKVDQLERFPRMYPVRASGQFRGHRWFLAAHWLVYYRVVGETIYIRGLWPARIP